MVEGLKSIGRVYGKSSSSVLAHVCPSGGIPPPRWRRTRLAPTLTECEEIFTRTGAPALVVPGRLQTGRHRR